MASNWSRSCCKRITMKLKSIFNMSQLDCSDSRIEEGSQEFHKLYKLGWVLGKGGFGTVFTTIRKKDKLHVVVKEVYKAKIIKKIADGKTPLEVALMQQVRDVPGAIRILDWFEMSKKHLHRNGKVHIPRLVWLHYWTWTSQGVKSLDDFQTSAEHHPPMSHQ